MDQVRVEIKLSNWIFGCGEFDTIVGKAAEEALQNTLDEQKPWLHFPSEDDAISKTNPLTIFLDLPFADDWDEDCKKCRFSEDIQSLILDELSFHVCDGKIDEENQARFKLMADQLKSLANAIEHAL